jgi:hypothetical protein
MKGMIKIKKAKKTQSILEYICVSIVFITAGFGALAAANRVAVFNFSGRPQGDQINQYLFSDAQGDVDSGSVNELLAYVPAANTLTAEALEDGVDQDEYRWPSTLEQPEDIDQDLPETDEPDGSDDGLLTEAEAWVQGQGFSSGPDAESMESHIYADEAEYSVDGEVDYSLEAAQRAREYTEQIEDQLGGLAGIGEVAVDIVNQEGSEVFPAILTDPDDPYSFTEDYPDPYEEPPNEPVLFIQ